MADPMPPAAASRSPSSPSERREDSLAPERPSPVASTGTPAADRDPDKKDVPVLDWSKFKSTFVVKYHAFPTEAARSSRKRKRGPSRKPLLEDNVLDESLRTLYTVEPAKWWDDTRRYRKFTISNERFRVGDAVFVKPDDSEASAGPLESWVAQVLEARAPSEQHVFLRVFWIYRPEDLPGGRRPYHGRNEVIASNRMQIIDALTVNGKVDLKHWTEEDGDDVIDADQLFWRQTYDWNNGRGDGMLSSLRKHCVDEAPFNPDSVLVHCDSCGIWLHAECLRANAIKQAHADKGLPEPSIDSPLEQLAPHAQAAENGHVSPTRRSGDEVARDDGLEAAFTAEIKTEANGKSSIVLKDTRDGSDGNEFERAIHCLKCKALIE